MRLFIYLFSLFIYFISLNVFSQNLKQEFIISGQIIDSISKQPIPYAQIVFKNRQFGTNSNEIGFFHLQQASLQDTILVSALGYKAISLLAKNIKQPAIIGLLPDTFQLSEVVITAKKAKYYNEHIGLYGPKIGVGLARIRGGFLSAGSQVALHLKNKDKKKGLVKAVFYRFHPDKEVKNYSKKNDLLARIRIFSVSSRQKPDRDLLLENIIVPVSINSHSIKVDLEKYNIEFPPEGVFVGIEFLNSSNSANRQENINKNLIKAPWVVMTHEEEENLTYINYRGRGWGLHGYGVGKDGKYRKFNSSNVRFGADILFEK